MISNDEKILIVEDDRVAMTSIVHYLNSQGYLNIQSFANGLDAVRAYEAEPDTCSLVLLDFELPDINGLEVAKRIRAIEKQSEIDKMLMPIVVTSSYVNQEQKHKFISLGVTHFFKKPLSENCKNAILKIMEIKGLSDGEETLNNSVALCAAQEQ